MTEKKAAQLQSLAKDLAKRNQTQAVEMEEVGQFWGSGMETLGLGAERVGEKQTTAGSSLGRFKTERKLSRRI